jgi:hypothetical protein
MTVRQKTVEYPFVTLVTDLATNTTLGTATRHDFAAITLDIPENSSRTFRSVIVQVTVRDRFAVVTNITAWRIGIKLAAVAFTDTDVTQTLTNSGDHMSFVFHTDVTSYFTTNFGSGASQTCQVGVAFATAAANTVQSVTAKLIVTYDYDDSGQDTRVKTVRIPLDGPLALLTATLAEIGTNQVPNLDSFLPESTKSYKHIWFESSFNDAGNATTDFNLALALDAEAESVRGTLEQALNTAVWGFDIWVRNDMTTNATHAFKARSSLISRFSGIGFVLCVTYTYSHTSSSTFINSLIFPFFAEPGFMPQSSGTNNRVSQEFWIEEPTTITLVQSGALFHYTSQGGQTINVAFGSQTTRAYVITAGSAQAGGGSFSHRFDSGSAGGSGISLARGKRRYRLVLRHRHAQLHLRQGQRRRRHTQPFVRLLAEHTERCDSPPGRQRQHRSGDPRNGLLAEFRRVLLVHDSGCRHGCQWNAVRVQVRGGASRWLGRTRTGDDLQRERDKHPRFCTQRSLPVQAKSRRPGHVAHEHRDGAAVAGLVFPVGVVFLLHVVHVSQYHPEPFAYCWRLRGRRR